MITVGKILGRLAQFRHAVKTPAAQVALAGTLLTIGVRIVESVLTDLVQAVEDVKLGRELEAHAMHSRITQVEMTLGQLGIDDDGRVFHGGRRAAAEAEAAASERGTEPELPDEVDGYPVGRAAAFPPAGDFGAVAGLRLVPEPERAEPVLEHPDDAA